MDTKIKIGIVGLGYWGPKLVEKFLNLPGVRIEVVCDKDEKLLSEISVKHNIYGTRSFDELLSDASSHFVDAIVVATPPDTHFTLVKKALERNKHVFVEKPLAVNSADAVELASLAKEKRKVLFVDHTFCYDEAFKKIKEMADKNEFGEIVRARFDWLGARSKENGPSVLVDSGPHAFAAMNYFIKDKPHTISMKVIGRLSGGVPSAMVGKAMFDGGRFAEVTLMWKDQVIDEKPVPKAARVSLVGTDKAVVYEGSFGSRSAVIHEKPIFLNASSHPLDELVVVQDFKKPVSLEGLTYKDEPLKAACEAFIKAIQGETKAVSDGLFGVEVVKILEAAAKSADKDGEPVEI